MTWTACLSSAWTVTWSPSFGTTSWTETRWILTLTTFCPTKASHTVSRQQHTAGCQAESEQASKQATLKSTSDCLTAGTERSSPKMSFTLPFRFLDLKKKTHTKRISFFLSSDLAAKTLPVQDVCPVFAGYVLLQIRTVPLEIHYNEVPNSLHHIIAEKTFGSWCAFNFCT